MAQFDKGDARRHQERVERARGVYGPAALTTMDRHADARAMAKALEREQEEEEE